MQLRIKLRSVAVFLVLAALTLSLGFLGACATAVPPMITQHPVAPIVKSEGMYLIASRHRDTIKESMTRAGLKPVDSPTGSYSLEVNVGKGRGSGDCGTVSNVNYILTSAGGRVMVIKGRGPTGSCDDNIFAAMSQKLASVTIE